MRIIKAEEGYVFKRDDTILKATLYLGIHDKEENYEQVLEPVVEETDR